MVHLGPGRQRSWSRGDEGEAGVSHVGSRRPLKGFGFFILSKMGSYWTFPWLQGETMLPLPEMGKTEAESALGGKPSGVWPGRGQV